MQGMELVFGKERMARVRASRVLVIGAGGIGSELLKNLVMCGFRDIEVIDLDTIEVSNLNRQFLFRRKHVGMSKAKVATEVVLSFIEPSTYLDDGTISKSELLSADVSELTVSSSSASIKDSIEDKPQELRSHIKLVGHLGNVKSSEFGQEFVSQFDLVLNALDNIGARRHVNRLCLSLNKPFIESGTRGYVGQVLPVVPGLTSCWECHPKETQQKSYAVCTIRSTPDQPVHCIVWAKMLFALMFGPKDSHSDIKDLQVGREESEPSKEYAHRMVEYLFKSEIEEQLSMKDKWKKRKPPHPLDTSTMELDQITSLTQYSKMSVLTIPTLIDIFRLSVIELCDQTSSSSNKNTHTTLEFDKDRSTMMAFVSSAANLRMECYNITMQSEFKNKGIAGNIVHAIATSNAIVSAHIIVEAIQVLAMEQFTPMAMRSQSKKDETPVDTTDTADEQNEAPQFGFSHLRESGLHYGWLTYKGPKYMSNQVVEPPNPECAVCQHIPQHLVIDLSRCRSVMVEATTVDRETTTNDKVDLKDDSESRSTEDKQEEEEEEEQRCIIKFGDFRDLILIKHCGMIDPSVTVECAEDLSKSRFIESRADAADDSDDDDSGSDDDLNVDSLPLTHGAIGFANGVTVRATDSAQDVTLEWILHDRPLDPEKHPNGFAIVSRYSPSDFPLCADTTGDDEVVKDFSSAAVVSSAIDVSSSSVVEQPSKDIVVMTKPRLKKRKAMEMEATSTIDSGDMDNAPETKRSKV